MSDKKGNVVVEAAAHLLANRPRHRTEGNVQSDVEALLRAMRVGTIESHYQIGSDQADIYLPNRRTFIECKPYPKAADPAKPQSRKIPESPREQLDRYVLAEIGNELQLLRCASSCRSRSRNLVKRLTAASSSPRVGGCERPRCIRTMTSYT